MEKLPIQNLVSDFGIGFFTDFLQIDFNGMAKRSLILVSSMATNKLLFEPYG